MDASQLYKSGKLAEAIDAQLAIVKAKPMDHGQRLFLFELLAFSGDIDRAQKQIDALDPEEIEVKAAVAEYRKLIDSERARRKVFAGTGQPEFLVPPSEAMRQRLMGVLKLSANEVDAAAAAIHQANADLPSLKGTLNGNAFDGFRDGDDCLAGVLEVCTRGQYFWVPLDQIKSLTMSAPRFPRHLLWIPAELETQTGDSGSVFLPALYPGTETEADPLLKLGRMTDWRGEKVVRGVGLKTFFVGPDESGILDWRKLIFA